MNKTLIALAIVAALPVAAQADATLSGSVNTKYKSTGVIDTDARLSMAVSEVLANGMTATAAFAILADTDDDTENQGTASLAGDFGMLTVGEIDADGAFQAGDVAGVVANTTESTSSTSSSVYGIHYAGTVAGLSVAAQVNAGSDAAGSTGVTAGTADNAATGVLFTAPTTATSVKSTQIGATYNFNDLTVGYSYASAIADTASTANHDGIHEGQSAFGVSYAFGDLVVTAGKVNYKDATTATTDTVVSATYTMNVDALTVVAQLDNNPSGDYQIDLSYALTDALTISSEIDSTDGKDTTLVVTYSAGDMSASVANQDDGTTDASVTLDYGNADLTIGRVGARAASLVNTAGSAEYTHISYKVSF
jgi:predicted porin